MHFLGRLLLFGCEDEWTQPLSIERIKISQCPCIDMPTCLRPSKHRHPPRIPAHCGHYELQQWHSNQTHTRHREHVEADLRRYHRSHKSRRNCWKKVIQVVPGRAGGGSFRRKKNYIAKKEFAYRMCARRPTSAMPKPFLCCERAFCCSTVVMWPVLMSWSCLRDEMQ